MSERLSQPLVDFLRAGVPTFQAAELLVFLAGNRDRWFTPEEAIASIRPVILTVPAVCEYVALFEGEGLVEASNGRFSCAALSPDLEQRLSLLVLAYHERPVTLIAEIYRLADDSTRRAGDRSAIPS